MGAGLLLLLLCSHSSEMVVSISKVELLLLDTDILEFDLYVCYFTRAFSELAHQFFLEL